MTTPSETGTGAAEMDENNMIELINRRSVKFYNIKVEDSYYGGGGHSGSRDFYGVNLPCKVSGCPCNSRGKCEMPSKVQINANGQCEFGAKILAGEESMKKGNGGR